MFKCNFILVGFFQFIYWKSSLFGTFATHAFSRLFKCEQCDREETQKHLLSTHKRVGTKFKCNQCDRIACQWCSLKSHKKRKYIKYQCDHCHYKPSKNQLKNNDRNIKGQINIRFHLPKPHDSSSGDVPRPRMILSYSQSLCINVHMHHPVTPEPIKAERWQ